MKKRLIKKKVKRLSNKELNEYVAYSSGFWLFYSELEFEKRNEELFNN